MAQFAVGTQYTQVWAGGPVLLANQDLDNPVTIGTTPNVAQDAVNTDVVPPLGSVAYGPSTGRLYAVAPNGTAALLVIAGGISWAPSPAQVALQLQQLGLAKDTTVAALPAGIQQMGVPPFIPLLLSAQALQIGPSGSPDTLVAFSNPGRIWACHLSFAIATNTGHSGTDQAYARLITGANTLTVVEVAASGTTGTDSGDSDLVFNGLPTAQGDTIKLDVNNGTTITGAIFRASAVVLYSSP